MTNPGSILSTALGALLDEHPGFADHFRWLDFDWEPTSHHLHGEFLYPLFGHGGPNIDALVENIYDALVPFCLPRGEVRRTVERVRNGGDFRELVRLGDRARELFVRSDGAAANGGEAGELILFLLLEQRLRAPLLVSKMNLKTSTNMNVHGRDGIHVRYSPELRSLVLHLGEAKLHKNLSSAVDEAIESVAQYLSDYQLRRREIAIINGHMDLTGLDPGAEAQLRAILDPYSLPPPNLPTRHTCLIGFEYAAYRQLAQLDPREIEALFIERYKARAKEICVQIGSKVGERLPPPTSLTFFVMPFPDLKTFRRTFAQKLGVACD